MGPAGGAHATSHTYDSAYSDEYAFSAHAHARAAHLYAHAGAAHVYPYAGAAYVYAYAGAAHIYPYSRATHVYPYPGARHIHTHLHRNTCSPCQPDGGKALRPGDAHRNQYPDADARTSNRDRATTVPCDPLAVGYDHEYPAADGDGHWHSNA